MFKLCIEVERAKSIKQKEEESAPRNNVNMQMTPFDTCDPRNFSKFHADVRRAV